jgi:parallel beta-helix repeat protein
MLTGMQIIRRALPLLAAAGACALSASSALAAPAARVRPAAGPRTGALLKPAGKHFAKATRSSASASAVHTITSCGYVATAPGTYNVTQDLTDSGGGNCITIEANHVTLNLNSHKITGTGTDNCIYVGPTSTSYESLGDSVVGGATGSPRGNLQGCGTGVDLYFTSGASVTNINVHSPVYYGIYEDYIAAANISHISIYAPSGLSDGFYGEYGAGNTVSHVNVDESGSGNAFNVYYEYNDNFTNDVARDSYNGSSGNSATGFYDEYSNRNTYSGDKSVGHEWGFYFYEDDYGTVTAKNNTASDPNSSEDGFYAYYAVLEYDYADPVHTVISGNKTNGFDTGYYDENGTSYSVRETYSGNTADNYTGYGFYFTYPTDFVISNNTADANTTSTTPPRWVSGTYGFYFYYGDSYYGPLTLSGNQSYDNEYGYYSDSDGVTGTNNIAKRDKYKSYDVEYNV